MWVCLRHMTAESLSFGILFIANRAHVLVLLLLKVLRGTALLFYILPLLRMLRYWRLFIFRVWRRGRGREFAVFTLRVWTGARTQIFRLFLNSIALISLRLRRSVSFFYFFLAHLLIRSFPLSSLVAFTTDNFMPRSFMIPIFIFIHGVRSMCRLSHWMILTNIFNVKLLWVFDDCTSCRNRGRWDRNLWVKRNFRKSFHLRLLNLKLIESNIPEKCPRENVRGETSEGLFCRLRWNSILLWIRRASLLNTLELIGSCGSIHLGMVHTYLLLRLVAAHQWLNSFTLLQFDPKLLFRGIDSRRERPNFLVIQGLLELGL